MKLSFPTLIVLSISLGSHSLVFSENIVVPQLAIEAPAEISPTSSLEEEEQLSIEEKSELLAEAQDELSADVMELVESQTVPQVVDLLEQVETIMAEATDQLLATQTGGDTMAAQTEIIEKILEAAKEKQQSSGDGSPQSQESMGAMLDMMERMMGKEPSGQKPGDKEGKDGKGNSGGEGQTGDSDMQSEAVQGSSEGNSDSRTIPRGSGPAGENLPQEFRHLLDAYNQNS